MRIRTPHRTAATTLAAGLAGLSLAIPAGAAVTLAQGTLQDQVNAIHRTGTVGVLAELTGPGAHRYATASPRLVAVE
jgi:D-alanyl-D-alanine carboxypeptidase